MVSLSIDFEDVPSKLVPLDESMFLPLELERVGYPLKIVSHFCELLILIGKISDRCDVLVGSVVIDDDVLIFVATSDQFDLVLPRIVVSSVRIFRFSSEWFHVQDVR